MQFIRSIKRFYPARPNGRTILYMHGYGGYTWQAARQINVLKKEGYEVVALDFTKILHNHDPKELIDLMDEVDSFLQKEKLITKDLIMIGISLGGLIGYNMLRRHDELKKLFVITGGNIALLPFSYSLKKHWGISREELADKWSGVNMYTPIGELKNKNIIMLLPLRDKIINPDEVTTEVNLQKTLNNIGLIRTKGGHYRTIITTTILKPRSILEFIHKLESSS